MKYRSRTDIVTAILQAIQNEGGSANKTKIMYSAYLSYAQLKEYISVLLDNGLIAYDANTEQYSLAAKGKTFLHTARTLSGALQISH